MPFLHLPLLKCLKCLCLELCGSGYGGDTLCTARFHNFVAAYWEGRTYQQIANKSRQTTVGLAAACVVLVSGVTSI